MSYCMDCGFSVGEVKSGSYDRKTGLPVYYSPSHCGKCVRRSEERDKSEERIKSIERTVRGSDSNRGAESVEIPWTYKLGLSSSEDAELSQKLRKKGYM